MYGAACDRLKEEETDKLQGIGKDKLVWVTRHAMVTDGKKKSV